MKASMPPFVKVSRTTETEFSPDSHVRGGETAQQRSQEGSDTRTPSLSAQPRPGWVHPPSTACLSITDVSLLHHHLNLRRCVGATASTPSPPASLRVLPPAAPHRASPMPASPPAASATAVAGCTSSHHADQPRHTTPAHASPEPPPRPPPPPPAVPRRLPPPSVAPPCASAVSIVVDRPAGCPLSPPSPRAPPLPEHPPLAHASRAAPPPPRASSRAAAATSSSSAAATASSAYPDLAAGG